jgi:hypothetical protein
MKLLLMIPALLLGQVAILQGRQVVHLPANQAMIDVRDGGKLLELANSPAIVHLPAEPQKLDEDGNPWTLDVKNLGPVPVSVAGKAQFHVMIGVGQTVHISSNGSAYSLKYGASTQ